MASSIYVPRLFSEIFGHQKQKAYFQGVLASKTISHAYCFYGLSGIGKKALAKVIAREVLCENHKESITKFDSDNHPDYLEVTTDTGSIKTEQIEALHHFMHVKPYLSSHKVVVIDNADAMTDVAQNKMLKLLEEPPGHALFIFVTDNPLKLLETVRSRLVKVAFQPLDMAAMTHAIEAIGLQIDEKVLAAALGSLERYVRWHEDHVFSEGIQQLSKALRAICEGKRGQWITALKLFEDLKDDSRELFDFILVWFLDLTYVKAGLDRSYLRLSFEYESMVQYSGMMTTHALNGARDAVLDAVEALERQQNYALVVDSMFFNIQEAIHGKGNRR